MSAPVIALYLGESYASLGVFDLSQKEYFEKSVFLPQISFKNLLLQTKTNISQIFNLEEPVQFYIVTKYLDRLKNFRLGGSVTQVVGEGFENSYSVMNSKNLSLAAASLVISIHPERLNQSYLESEYARIKKINADTNKVVIQISDKVFSKAQKQMVIDFFSQLGFKIFVCEQPENLAEIRKSLLNAGTEGTKEEIHADIKEVFGEHTIIKFWSEDSFKSQIENYQLFNSSSSFIASLAQKANYLAYFDHESFRLISAKSKKSWQSPWGTIPASTHDYKELYPNPFSELRLDHLSLLSISQQTSQHEPGPICAGRGIKPLVIDLFCEELSDIQLIKSIFSQFNSEPQKQKLQNHLSVLEKGQNQTLLKTNRAEIKNFLKEELLGEISHLSRNNQVSFTGPLAKIFNKNAAEFHWPKEIAKKVLV